MSREVNAAPGESIAEALGLSIISPTLYFRGLDRAHDAIMAKRQEGRGPWGASSLAIEISERVQVGHARVLSVIDDLIDQGILGYTNRYEAVRFLY